MFKLLLATGLLGLLSTLQSCSQGESHNGLSYAEMTVEEHPKTAAELRAELLQREQHAPTEYLSVQGSHHRNLISQLVLEGDIINQATMARFKDPVLSVTWYSKTQTELETKQYPVFEIVRPQGSTHYKFKTNAPDYVATVSIGIASATPIE